MFSSRGKDLTLVPSLSLDMNFGIAGFAAALPLFYNLATALAPMALLGAALCFFKMAAVISEVELLLLRLSPLLLMDEPLEHLSQF